MAVLTDCGSTWVPSVPLSSDFVGLAFNGQVNMLSRSVHLVTFFLGRFSPLNR